MIGCGSSSEPPPAKTLPPGLGGEGGGASKGPLKIVKGNSKKPPPANLPDRAGGAGK